MPKPQNTHDLERIIEKLIGQPCSVWQTTDMRHDELARGFHLQVMWGTAPLPLWHHWRWGTMFRSDMTFIGTFELVPGSEGYDNPNTHPHWSATLAGLEPDGMRIERIIRDAVLLLA